MAYRPAIAFALAIGRGTRRRRRGRRRTYALGAVGPGAEDGRGLGGDVDHVDGGRDGGPAGVCACRRRSSGRCSRRPTETPRRGEEGGEGPLTDLVDKAPDVD